jgi:hypothetical protein
MSVAVDLLLPSLPLGIGVRPMTQLDEHLRGGDDSREPRG